MTSGKRRLTRSQILSQSWPIMLANAAAPIVGLVDTFVIGRYASTAALAGIGLGAVIYGIVYWGFGFLRMSTTGLAAQSDGEGDEKAVQGHLVRAVPLGLAIGLSVFVLQTALLSGAFLIFTADEGIEGAARTYIMARLWGLPATLASIALIGWFVGISRSHRALLMQIVLNVVNVILSLYFVIGLEWGLFGVGIASALAEWAGLAAGLFLAWREIKLRGGFVSGVFKRKSLLDPAALKKLGITNGNIFVRTMTLTIGFNFFGNAAASEGTIFLAGNHILLQFITLSALILDAFAHTAEAVTGAAFGAKDRERFGRAVRLTTEFSAFFGLACGLLIYTAGGIMIPFLTADPAVQESALKFLPFCALAPILGFPAWQLDGIFIGTTRTKEMRNAGIAAVTIYIAAHFVLQPTYGGYGIWAAFLIYYVARAATLAMYLPNIFKHMKVDHENQTR